MWNIQIYYKIEIHCTSEQRQIQVPQLQFKGTVFFSKSFLKKSEGTGLLKPKLPE